MINDVQCHERLTNVFRVAFEDPKLEIKDEFTAASIPGWDSLMHINLIVSIEEEFGTTFSTAEIAGFKCIGDVKRLLLQKVSL